MDKRKGKTLVRKRPSVDLQDHDLTLDQLFERFYSYKTSQGLRDRTLREHQKLYSYFRDWLQQKISNPKVEDISRDTVQAYITYMAQERVQFEGHKFSPAKYATETKIGLNPMTINIRLRALKCFLKYGYDNGYFEENPIAGVRLFKTDEDEIGAFTEQQVQKLLKTSDKKTYAGFRDYTLMTLLLDTGLRISEALSITNEMVDCNVRLITLSGKVTKNRRLRQVPLSQETAKLLKQLQQENEHFFYSDLPDYIFLTAFGDLLTPNIFSRRLKQYAKKGKISGVRVSPHTFRHTFAKYYILNGGDPFSLQNILGHSTMDMVRKYVQMYSEDVKIQHNKFSPLKRLQR